MPFDNKADGVNASFEKPNKFDGEGNPDQGEQYDIPLTTEPNKFPRDGGSDSYTGIPGDGVVPG